ncbi:MarR family winged helix-turn-helix transcriptional regulator [Arsenicicoccus dermatophilus]|uniref:MarR family winged helix-turn-helix transcriptional regulator n=1 Tax=Arsenicicoccus dermatophilus TaxID=1076331 RepID=UPI00391741CD
MPSLSALEHQLCFALYSAARVTQAAYRPVLTELGLTYPQWLVLLALGEDDGATVSALGEHLHLDSGTVSPLLQRMETRGVVERRRVSRDGRQVTIHLTDDGRALLRRAPEVQDCLAAAVPLSPQEITTLRDLAHRLAAAPHQPGRPEQL